MNEPEKRSLNYPLRRREVVQELLKSREGLLVVAGLGAPAWDATASGDHPLTFPLWGGMGGAVSIGLGLALAQPNQRVLVILRKLFLPLPFVNIRQMTVMQLRLVELP